MSDYNNKIVSKKFENYKEKTYKVRKFKIVRKNFKKQDGWISPALLTDSPWDPQAWKEMGGPMTPTFFGGLGVYHDPFQWPWVKFSIFGLDGLRNGLAIFYKVNLRLLKMTLLRSPWPQCHSTFWDLWKCGKKDSNNFWPPYTVEAGAASIEKKDPKLGHKKNGFDSFTETSGGHFVTKNT